MQNLISCRPESFSPYTDRAYESLQRLGIRYVELRAPAPALASQAVKDLDKYGLIAASVAFYHRLQEPDFQERVSDAVETAAIMGAPVIFTSQHTDGLDRNEVYERLRRAGETAAKRGVILAMETHPDLCANAKSAIETMQGVNHPNIRINFDPANTHYYNHDVNAVRELRQIASYVRSVHLKDTDGGFESHHFPAIGEGVVEWKALFALLNDRGMYGPFTLEMEGIAGETLSYDQTYSRIEQSLDYLREIQVYGS